MKRHHPEKDGDTNTMDLEDAELVIKVEQEEVVIKTEEENDNVQTYLLKAACNPRKNSL